MNLAFTYHATVKKKSNLISSYINTKEWLFDETLATIPQIQQISQISQIQQIMPNEKMKRNIINKTTIEEEIRHINNEKQMILDMSANTIKTPRKVIYSMTDLMYLPKSQCNSCRK